MSVAILATFLMELQRCDAAAYVTHYIYDEAGNLIGRSMVLDQTPPVTTASPQGGFYNTPQSVTLTCNDGTGAGCDKIYYTTDGTTPTTSSPVYSSPINIPGDTTLKFFATDIGGNSETVKTEIYTFDTVAPTGTAVINGGAAYTNNTTATLTLTCSDDLSGCSKMRFSNDGNTYSDPENYVTPKSWVLASGDGTKTVYAKFRDTAGNWSTIPCNDTIVLDTQAPTGTITINGGATYTNGINVTLTLTCNDVLSGCSQMQFSNDNSTYSDPEAYAATKSWTLTPGSGTRYVYAKFLDAAGNPSNPLSDTIILNSSCSNPAVRIGSTPYDTLQAAYNAASNGNVIKVQGVMLTENLTVNRNVTVTLEGGYDCGFTSNYGNVTAIKGSITTTVEGGTLTIKNFILSP